MLYKSQLGYHQVLGAKYLHIKKTTSQISSLIGMIIVVVISYGVTNDGIDESIFSKISIGWEARKVQKYAILASCIWDVS